MNKLIARLTRAIYSVRHERGGTDSRSSSSAHFSGLERMAALLEMFVHVMKQVSVKGFLVTGMLLMLVVMSAIGVVYSSHLSRQLFAEQAILLEKNDQLQLEWAQLLLEQSAWSSPNRIESVAREQLGMQVPETEKIQLIY
jgi:cell division protein FtsL